MPLIRGQKLAAYEIVSTLGAGGMGEVYRAKDTRLGRDVALKILPPEMTNEAGRLERFDREARAIAALNHPHIVTIYSTEEHGNIRFMTMELVEGSTLSDLVMSSGMAVPRFLDIAIPLADALAAAHQKQITHRDLKPGNVMVSNDGRVKVLDFGLARVGGGDVPEQTLIETLVPITQQGVIVGTMPYMSPEQVEGRAIDARSDLFSLGVMFYELLAGERPFRGGSSAALMSAILRDTPPPLSQVRQDVPDVLERLVSRLIEKRPEDRVQTARDVFNELRHIRKQAESGSARQPAPSAAAVPDNLWIAVLPFNARGGDPDAEALAVGLTDDVAASLARFPGLSVIASQSTRAFRDSPLDIRQIAERLRARYVIAGNVRKAGAIMRTTAQVIDASSGEQLWTENYDRRIDDSDLFAVQDDLTDHIVATVGDKYGVLAKSMVKSLDRDGIARSTSVQLLLHSWAFQHRPMPDVHAELRSALERRVAAEPQDAHLWAELANMYVVEHSLGFNALADPIGRAGAAARRAIELDRGNQVGWLWLAIAHFHEHDRAGFDEACDRTLKINPRNAYAMAWMGNILTHIGEYERGCALTERAMQINPGHPGWLHFAVFNREFAAGEYQRALQAARRVNIREFFWMHFAVAAACGQLGMAEDGRKAASELLRLAPQLSGEDALREFVAKWYWPDEMNQQLIAGVQQSMSTGAAGMSRSEAGSKPPSSHGSGATSSGAFTVAVLPFVSRRSDDESASLADGLTDDIIAGLSKFGYVRVQARSNSDRGHARYAIEGTVRRSGATLRIGVTLVDSHSGTHLWTQNYDRNVESGAFVVQDDVASAVVTAIGDPTGALMRSMAEGIAGKPIEQLTAAELVVRYHLYQQSFRADEHLRLRNAFEAALVREPRSAEAWACLAMLYEHERGFNFNPLPAPLARQRRAAEQAVELDPRSQQAWIAMASTHAFARDREGLKASVERAVALNPLNADLIASGAIFLSLAGENDRAVPLMQDAMKHKPQPPGWYRFPAFNSAFVRGDFETALKEIKSVSMPKTITMQSLTAAVAGHLGRTVEAKVAIDALRAINPAMVDGAALRTYWAMSLWDDAHIDKLADGFSKAVALEQPSSSSAIGRSIAVLPFADLSEKKDQDWFCDGIAEEILSALSPLPGIRVAARASSFSFKGKNDDLRAIAEKLNVETVLEGSVRRAGDRVRITTQLSDAREGRQLWSERFDRELKDIFDVQDEIARAIVGRLKPALSNGKRLVQQRTSNLEAYELLLKGRMLVTRRGRAVLDAIPLFERAIEFDPNLSEAHALLGDAYRLLGLYGIARASEVMPRARACVDRALAIDPNSAEALATLAIIATVYEWDLDALRSRSAQALAADPEHVRALAERGISLAVIGKPNGGWEQESLRHVEKARALDPLNAWVVAIHSACLMYTGSVTEAVDTAARAIEIDPGNFTGHWLYCTALAEAGRLDESLAAAVPAMAMSGRHTMILSNVASVYAEIGEIDKMEAIRAELRERAQTQYISEGARAIVAAAAGHWDEARELLELAIAEHDPWVAFWKLYAWRPIWKDDVCAAMIRATSLFDFDRK